MIEKLLKENLEEQQKTNELLQVIVSNQEQRKEVFLGPANLDKELDDPVTADGEKYCTLGNRSVSKIVVDMKFNNKRKVDEIPMKTKPDKELALIIISLVVSLIALLGNFLK